VDFSDVALAQAREKRPDVGWVQADLLEFEPEPGAFDLVLVLYVHLPSAGRRELLARASGALAPGGTLVVLGHDVTNIGTAAPGPSNPDVLYEPNAVASELSGVTVTKSERLTRRLATDDGEADAVDALVVARKG
jgi:ubiquinone/menaquinone biosynthesis C-methylase UbiE